MTENQKHAYEYETLLVEFDKGVCVLTLNRPEKRNAMNPILGEEITDALENLRNDDRCSVLVITGAGESFCAGMDLKEFFLELEDKPAEYDRAHRLAVEWRGRTLRLFPKPTIAMVNGHCFGGAFTIVEGCDLAVAAEDAKMGLSEVNFKLFPGGSVGKSMGNLLRPRDYMLYALTGRPMSGQNAAEIGFVNYAVPREDLKENVMALAHEIAGKDASALQATREVYRFSLDMDWDTAMNYASALQAWHTTRQGNTFREEGIGDFLDKKYKPGLGSHENAKK
ncbi:MAG: p-hydroxycinnamoyl CoA hydratase/lyase [Pseudomonadota bacterium]|nr:p-hydroxycinnamoyl CoA hydratase/lyase [Pseudomonadota bacterium]